MYHRLCLNLYKRSLYCVSSGIKSQLNRFNHITSKNEQQQNGEVTSTKFPDYKLLYIFPYIKHVGNINTTKKRFTVFIGAAVPVTACLYLANIVSFDAGVSFIISGIIFAFWLHSLGLLCNNFIGYIYLKQDGSKLILSYVNYWGKRIDLETTANDIIPISDNQFRITDFMYKKITFSSRKETLKIDTRYGQITDDSFKYILGTT